MNGVSIVMPAFNASVTISESIDSVLRQTYSQWELLICDDGSSDETSTIIKQYLEKDNRIRAINNEYGKGVSGARNSCLVESRYKYVCFLDSDDIFHETKLEEQVTSMQYHQLVMSHSDYQMFDEFGNKSLISTPDLINFKGIVKKCDVGCLTVMLDMDELIKAGFNKVLFPKIVKEDYALWVLLMKKGIVSYRCGGAFSYYRRQAKSASSSKIKEVTKQWRVIRDVGDLSLLYSLYCLVTYSINGLLKHFFTRKKRFI